MSLTDAEYRAEKARVKKAFLKWCGWLGFGWWTDCTAEYWREHLTPNDFTGEDFDGTRVAADCHADWRYKQCWIRFSLQHTKEMDLDKLEKLVVHELCHGLINEMREDGIDHEERVVTELQQAFYWVEHLAIRAAKKKS